MINGPKDNPEPAQAFLTAMRELIDRAYADGRVGAAKQSGEALQAELKLISTVNDLVSHHKGTAAAHVLSALRMEGVVQDTVSGFKIVNDASIPEGKIEIRQNMEPNTSWDWRQFAISWLRMRAKRQDASNRMNPGHTRCYPNWTERVKVMRDLADELSHEVKEGGGKPPPVEFNYTAFCRTKAQLPRHEVERIAALFSGSDFLGDYQETITAIVREVEETHNLDTGSMQAYHQVEKQLQSKIEVVTRPLRTGLMRYGVHYGTAREPALSFARKSTAEAVAQFARTVALDASFLTSKVSYGDEDLRSRGEE